MVRGKVLAEEDQAWDAIVAAGATPIGLDAIEMLPLRPGSS